MMQIKSPDRVGFLSILQNRSFRLLWIAQVLTNLSLNSIFYLQLVFIEEVTHSTAHVAAMVLAYSLPAALLSAFAGVLVDRVSKKNLLVFSSATRWLTSLILIVLIYLQGNDLGGVLFITAIIYLITFITSAAGQFFAPAEVGMVPLVLKPEELLSANSLFSLTVIGTQVVGFVVLAPLGIKTLGLMFSLVLGMLLYVVATIFELQLPKDIPQTRATLNTRSVIRNAYHEIAEGWRYALTHQRISVALWQITLVFALIMVFATLVPSYAIRVLGLEIEDAVYVFAPAGIGLLITSFVISHWAQKLRRESMTLPGIFLIGIAVILIALVPWLVGVEQVPILLHHPESFPSALGAVTVVSLILGCGLALVQIPAQTVVQEESPSEIRGRVLTVEFTFINLAAIVPLVMVGNLADRVGVVQVTFSLGLIVLLFGVFNVANYLWFEKKKLLSVRNKLPL